MGKMQNYKLFSHLIKQLEFFIIFVRPAEIEINLFGNKFDLFDVNVNIGSLRGTKRQVGLGPFVCFVCF